jgi:hypothetical protein
LSAELLGGAAENIDNAVNPRWPRPWANLSQKFARLRLVPNSGLSAELLGGAAEIVDNAVNLEG